MTTVLAVLSPTMIHHLRAQLDAFRLGVHQRDLRRREQDALARLGKMTLGEGGTRVGRLAALATEAAAARSRLDALSGERRASGAANRGALQRRRESLEQKLRELHLIAGRLVMAMPATEAGTEVLAIRAELTNAASERDRLHAEGRRLGEELLAGARAWFTPRAPALTAMALGWWITSRYTESHIRTILKSLGLSPSRRGTHLVSASTDTLLIEYGLPLLAAVLCASLGNRLAAWGQTAADAYRSRSSGVAGEI
jgi:hypothetical protein